MKMHVLIKYNFFLLFILLNSCNQKTIRTIPANVINKKENNSYKVQKYLIIKGKDTISLNRKFSFDSTKFIDTTILKQGVEKTEIVFPSIGYHGVELRKFLPKKRMYNFSPNKFLVQANYKDFFIQYVFNGSINKIDGIFIITDIDDKYPDFNRTMNDTIAKIEYIKPALKNTDVHNYLYKFSHLFVDNQLNINTIYYIQRKEGLKKIIY